MPDRVLSFDELNNLATQAMADALADIELTIYGGLADRKIDRKRIEDTIFDLLTIYYAMGYREVGLSLGEDIPMSERLQQDAVLAPTKGMTAFERIDEHITAAEQALSEGVGMDAVTRLIEQLRVVADTEAHRVINVASYEAAEAYQKAHPQATVFKTWNTMEDDRVRDTHFYLEGSTVPLDARFYTYDGDSALFPGDFEFPQNVINCRCWLTYTAI